MATNNQAKLRVSKYNNLNEESDQNQSTSSNTSKRVVLPSSYVFISHPISDFADEMKKARKIGAFKEYMVGRSSEVTFATVFEKYEAIIRYLAAFDYTGENLKTSHKQEAAKHCNCTIADVENALAKFTWAKEAQKKIQELNKEGKPMPKNIAELQKLVGTNPLDLARSNLAKSGQVSRNAPCPCGSKKRYKRCCGKD
ncbi:uncharacterized protein LOC127091159 [Lathyrus oleraceus]|uniref:uncharacterized protein LOC127091159 n=1 Tax=Pisum sativum TaxID=3888 RepID=UPI0021D282D5|nr:uncharacterized protein LOC127091159 [Pisum sativum]